MNPVAARATITYVKLDLRLQVFYLARTTYRCARNGRLMVAIESAGRMSTPQGPRGMSHSRGRGNSRGAVKSRGSRFTKGENANGDYSTNNMTRGAETRRRLKPPPNQGNIRNKSWKNPSTLGAAVLSHAGRIPDPRGEAWRDPGTADSSVYKEGMNDHYQTVCVNTPEILTVRYA